MNEAGISARLQMTRGAMYAFMTLALVCIGIATFNVYLWNDSRSARAELKAERAARLTQRQQDERAQKTGRVQQCVQSISVVAIANYLIDGARADHRTRARQARLLAKADPTDKLRRVHLANAKEQDKVAAALTDFPRVTQAKCDRLADRLGVARIKLTQLRRSNDSGR